MVNLPALREWLAQPRTELITAVGESVRKHVAAMRANGLELKGYALYTERPRGFFTVDRILAICTIRLESRFLFDEWKTWDRSLFEPANVLLAGANARFSVLHPACRRNGRGVDEYMVAHVNSLLDAVIEGIAAAKADGVFGDNPPFLAVCEDDVEFGGGIASVVEAVVRLNPKTLADEYFAPRG
jgi:hypothetical protein